MNLILFFVQGSVYITDLDENGKTETTFFYRTTCRSDVRPSDIEMIMYENKDKYTLKGKTFMIASHLLGEKQVIDQGDYELNLEKALAQSLPNSVFSGRFNDAHDFDNAPMQFLEFAIEKWRIHVKEKY